MGAVLCCLVVLVSALALCLAGEAVARALFRLREARRRRAEEERDRVRVGDLVVVRPCGLSTPSAPYGQLWWSDGICGRPVRVAGFLPSGTICRVVDEATGFRQGVSVSHVSRVAP